MNWKNVKRQALLAWWAFFATYDFTGAVKYSVSLLKISNPIYFIGELINIALLSCFSLYFYKRLKRSERLFELEEKYGIS